MLRALPDTVQFTVDIISAWRRAGYRVSEQRTEGWLHVVVRAGFDSAVYRLTGPRFTASEVVYDGWRIA